MSEEYRHMNMTKETSVDVEARRLIVTLNHRYEPQSAVFRGQQYSREAGEGIGEFYARVFESWPPELEWVAFSVRREGEEADSCG